MFVNNYILQFVNLQYTEFYKRLHNVIAACQGKYYRKNEDYASTGPGMQLWGYLNFRNLLDKQTQKLKIPKNISQIKIDVGLSFGAPNSALWLDNLHDRIVFGFEPNPENVRDLLTIDENKRGKKPYYLSSKYLNNRFFLFNAAIDNCRPQLKTFYMAKDDPGTSSLHKPIDIKIKRQVVVPCFSLSDFLSLIPWKRFNYVEHLKIDTQGNDLRVLQSAGRYLHQIVFITAECTAEGYTYSHTSKELDKFMKTNKFEFIKNTEKKGNKTFVNLKYKNLIKKLDYSTFG